MTTKRIVLTGATRGLGRAMARGFAALGHTVLGCGRGVEQLEALRNELGDTHHFAAVDVRDEAAVRAWADEVLARFGPPDLLINNAAVINTPRSLWDVPADEFDRLIDINIGGVARVVRAFVPAMVARKQGVIVNFSSGWGRSTSPEMAPYCASKFAIEGLTRALAQELPRGMAAVPLNPGVIDTDMLRSAWAEAASGYPNPEKWAERAMPFLLSLEAKHNGQPLSIG
jgi:NAD(P)-dependent dehydrogenase (short-subunit alcohol dehydrogenase family)